jgi:predicted RNA-binding protein with PIN domain
MEYLLVDGYNVINAWGHVFNLNEDSLETCRTKLLHMLSNYQGYKKINIIVVFDGYLVKKSPEKKEKFDNLTIVFTKEHETADNYIERFVYKNGADNIIRVVTSDYLEQTIVLSKGGIRISPRELRQEVEVVCNTGKQNYEKKNSISTNSLASNIKPELRDILEKMRRNSF